MDKQKIDILIATKAWQPEPWVEGLKDYEFVNKVHVWPTNADLSNVEALFVWKPLDAGVVEKLPNLKWVSSLGAGVDHLVGDEQIPAAIPITRIVDPYLTRDMTNYCIMGVMLHQRSFFQHQANQQQKVWDRIAYQNLKVGVMGLGALGGHLAEHLVALGFEVSGFSRTQKQIAGVKCYAQQDFETFLSVPDVIVNLLPVTPQTENILNKETMLKMRQGAYLINVARGNHLVEEDLINVLDSNYLSGALLDVFRQEPLPKDHPFWNHPKITLTPHVASVTTPASALKLLKANIERLINREQLQHVIDRSAGY